MFFFFFFTLYRASWHSINHGVLSFAIDVYCSVIERPYGPNQRNDVPRRSAEYDFICVNIVIVVNKPNARSAGYFNRDVFLPRSYRKTRLGLYRGRKKPRRQMGNDRGYVLFIHLQVRSEEEKGNGPRPHFGQFLESSLKVQVGYSTSSIKYCSYY